MQNLFISPDDEFTVNFSVAIDEEGTIFCDISRESLLEYLESMAKNINDFSIEDYKAIFRKPSFGDTVEMYSEIYTLNNSGLQFNPLEARFKMISTLIKSWNLKGKEIKPSEEEIRELHPLIANAIGISLDLIVGGIFN